MKTFLLFTALVVAVAHALPHPEYFVEQDSAGRAKLQLVDDQVPENFWVPETDITFTIYGPGSDGVTVTSDEIDAIRSSAWDISLETKILIHGWSGSFLSEVNTLIKQAYDEHSQNFNVIVVDWEIGAATTLFQTARNRIGVVGGYTSEFLKAAKSALDLDLSTVSIIGHNLGGHIAGLVGKNFYEDNDRIGSIVALDASMNLFSIDEPTQRVAEGDALYVESIHTNTGQNGFDQPLGDASFYPAFGNRQPGCGLDITGSCSHLRAVEYFAESINTTRHFWSRECERYKDILMETCTASGVDRKMGGQPVETLARGIYWCSTNNNAPFATGVL